MSGPGEDAACHAVYERQLRTQSAIILHHPPDAAFARKLAEYIETADQRVAPYLGRSDHSLRFFIHAGAEEILRRVGAGEAYALVMESLLGGSLEAFDREVQLNLLLEGITRLYPWHAVALLCSMVLLLGGIRWWWIRRRSVGFWVTGRFATSGNQTFKGRQGATGGSKKKPQGG